MPVRVKHPKYNSPIDLGAKLLVELAHLFDVESRAWCDACSDFHARDEIEEMNRRAISEELSYFADVLEKRDRSELERGCAPWEKMKAAEQVRVYSRLKRPPPGRM